MNQPMGRLGELSGDGRPQAMPVHHVIEEKTDPITGKKVQVGTNLRERMVSERDKWRALSQDPSVPMHYRKQYAHMANQMEVDIGEEDAFHAQQESELGPLEAQGAFAGLQGERSRARGGSAPQGGKTGVVQAPGSAPKPFIPPR